MARLLCRVVAGALVCLAATAAALIAQESNVTKDQIRRFVPRAGTITIHQTEKGALSAGGSAAAGSAAAATASPAAATVLPTFDVSVTYTGTTTIVGGPPQAGGTTVIPTVLIPVSFVFDEYRDANGQPLVIEATPAVRQVVQSPIFQSHPFSTGYTQYGDAMQRAAFWSSMASNWHTLLGPPDVLPALQIEIPPGHAYVMSPPGSRELFADVDVTFVQNALAQAIAGRMGTVVTPGQLALVLFRNTAFYGTVLPVFVGYADDPTVCCSFGQHGLLGPLNNSQQTFVLASYVDPGLLPLSGDGMVPQSYAPLTIASDVQAVSEQIAEWLNDPFSDPSAFNASTWTIPGNVFPFYQAPDGVLTSCDSASVGDIFFSAGPTHFLMPSQAAATVVANGMIYHLENAALLPWYAETSPSPAINGAYSFPDTSVLTGPAQPCGGSFATPTAPPLPESFPNGHALIGYWSDPQDLSLFFPISQAAPQFDVVIVSAASPVQNSTSLLAFSPPVEETADQFKADVRNLHGQGRKALISLYGGGSTPLTLNTKADIQNFVSSVTSIVQQYGFDGIDLDIENPSLVLNPGDTDFRNPTTPSIVNLIAACRQLRKQFGPGFILTMVPEVVQVQGGFDSYTGTSGSFLPVIYALRDILTFVDAQDYDTPPLPALDGNFYIPGTTDYHVAMTELLLQGFPVGHNPGHFFPPLPPQKVAIGTVASPLMRNFVSTSGLSDALNYLIKGESYGGQYKLQNPAGYPNLLGMMTWNINLDQWSMNYGFSNTIGALLHDLPRTCPPSECPL